MDWHVGTDLKYQFAFPTEITVQGPDIVIWVVDLRKVFVVELTIPFVERMNWALQYKLKKYEDLREQCVKNGCITDKFAIVLLPTQPNLPYLTNL